MEEMVNHVREKLRRYGVTIPSQIRTRRGAKRYLEGQIRLEEVAIEGLQAKLEEKEWRIQAMEGALKELEQYKKEMINGSSSK